MSDTDDLAVQIGLQIITKLLEKKLGKPAEEQDPEEKRAALLEIKAKLDAIEFVHEDEILGEPV